jgi:hypothetical protein
MTVYLLKIVANTKYKHTKYQYTSPECFQSDHLLLQCTLRAGYRQVSAASPTQISTRWSVLGLVMIGSVSRGMFSL